jgi:hypothetical protein
MAWLRPAGDDGSVCPANLDHCRPFNSNGGRAEHERKKKGGQHVRVSLSIGGFAHRSAEGQPTAGAWLQSLTASSMRPSVLLKSDSLAGRVPCIIKRGEVVARCGAKKMRVIAPGHPVCFASVVVRRNVRASSVSVRPCQCPAGCTQGQSSDQTRDNT